MSEESAVRAPTLVIGIEGFGETILGRLRAHASALDDPPVRFIGVGGETPIPQVIEQVRELLDDLLRIQLGGPRARLDILLLADLGQGSAAAKSKAMCLGLSALLASDYGRIFPPSAPPDQRMVWLVPLFATPALSDNPETRSCLDLLSSLEKWHEAGPPSPILSRIYILPRQHEFGVMAEEDVERAVTMFAAAAWFSGLRDEPQVADLLAHTRPERLLSCFNAAAADVPVDRVVSYFGWRTIALGLGVLQGRCGRPGTEFGPRSEAESALGYSRWLTEIEEGDCVRAARDFGRQSDRVAVAHSARDRFRWSESPAAVEAEIAPLLAAVEGSVVRPTADVTVGPEDDAPILVQLDRAEVRARSSARERLRAYVDRELAPQDGLRRLGEIQGVLGFVEDWLRQRHAESGGHPLDGRPASRSGPGVTVSQGRQAAASVRQAVAGRPTLWGSLGLSAALGLLMVPSSIGIRAAFGSETNWGAASNIATVDWVLHSLVGVLLLGGWTLLRLSAGANRLRGAVLQLRNARDGQSHGPVVLPDGPAGWALDLRRARLAEALAEAVSEERARLAGLRTSVVEAVRRSAEELKRLGYQGGSDPRPGDAEGVLGERTPLHLHLLDPSGLEPLWRATRHTTDDEGWAAELLAAAWPKEGLKHDLPFDPERHDWVELARSGQHARLLESSVFTWPGVGTGLSDRLADFLREAPRALGLGADPHDEHGNPLPSNVSQNFLVVAPQEGRDTVRAAEKKANSQRATLFGVAPTSHVVLLRTHAGFTSHQLWHGIKRRSGA
jgi:hypothetical protein